MGEVILQGITVNELMLRLDKLIGEKLEQTKQSEKPETDDYITRKEAAKLLRITLPTLHHWTKTGFLPSHKIQTRVLYKRADIQRIIASGSFQRHNKTNI